MTQWSHKRKDDFFKRFKQQQEIDHSLRKKDVPEISVSQLPPNLFSGAKREFTIKNNNLNKDISFPLSVEDMDKLKPDTDLNDTIIMNYLRILEYILLPG